MRRTTDRILTNLENAGMALAVIALTLIMISITADAVARYFLRAPIKGQYEFTSLYLMVILAFMGLARSQALGGHIAIPVLARLLDRTPYAIPERATALIAALAFAFFAWVTGGEALERVAARTTTFGVVQFPTYLSYCWAPLGAVLLALRLLHQMIWPPPRAA